MKSKLETAKAGSRPTVKLCPLGKRLLKNAVLQSGEHSAPQSYDKNCPECVMELSAHIAIVCKLHEKASWGDKDPTVSPTIGAFLRSWNDSLNHEDRQMLKPYALKVLFTKGTDAMETERVWSATDWFVRECTPAWLELAGLDNHAKALRGLAPITDAASSRAAKPTLDEASAASRTAWNAARAAAGNAAGAAARAAAWNAARAAAGNAAGAAARAAAGNAAGAAAWAAAWAAAGAAAWAAAWDAARDAAGAAAWDAAWDAARDAAGAAARDAAGDAAWNAAWNAAGAAAWARLRPTVVRLQQSALAMLDRLIEVGA